jgi:hypothetical protein
VWPVTHPDQSELVGLVPINFLAVPEVIESKKPENPAAQSVSVKVFV